VHSIQTKTVQIWYVLIFFSIFIVGDIVQVEEDAEHEFKGIQNSSQPISLIAEHCEVIYPMDVTLICYQKYINAFLNTDGGTIYFGIHDDGTILGIPMSRKFRDAIRLRIDSIVSCT
jgi:predicted HTH transcriptional regulator